MICTFVALLLVAGVADVQTAQSYCSLLASAIQSAFEASLNCTQIAAAIEKCGQKPQTPTDDLGVCKAGLRKLLIKLNDVDAGREEHLINCYRKKGDHFPNNFTLSSGQLMNCDSNSKDLNRHMKSVLPPNFIIPKIPEKGADAREIYKKSRAQMWDCLHFVNERRRMATRTAGCCFVHRICNHQFELLEIGKKYHESYLDVLNKQLECRDLEKTKGTE